MSDDERYRLWDLPSAKLVEEDFVRTGYGELIPLTDAYLGIDTTTLKMIALNLYGIPSQHDNTGYVDKEDVPDVDAEGEVSGGGDVYFGLHAVANDVRTDLADVVQDWAGPAFESAKARRDGVAMVMDAEANDARRIGQALWVFADTVEHGQGELKAAILGGAELGLAGAGLGTASGPVGWAFAIAGFVIAIGSKLADGSAKAEAEAESYANAQDLVDGLFSTKDPTRDTPDLPPEPDDWERTR